jgi:hypothetical protein
VGKPRAEAGKSSVNKRNEYLTCPVCGWKFDRLDIHAGIIPCPQCKASLEFQKPGSILDRIFMVGAALLAICIASWSGASGFTFVLLALVLSVVICALCGLARGITISVLGMYRLQIYEDPKDTRILKL